MNAYKIVRGASGLLRCEFNIAVMGKSDARVQKRLSVCQDCDHCEIGKGGTPRRCEICECALPCKTRVRGERCPIWKWTPIHKKAGGK